MLPQAVIIADVIGSSSLDDEVRRDLDLSLRRMFAAFNSRCAAPLAYSLGDEFQAVSTQASTSIRPLFLMHAWLASQTPHDQFRFRSAIGVGRVAVQTSRLAREQDGPAFHIARKLVDRLHKQKSRFGIACDDHDDAPIVAICNTSFDVSCRLVSATIRDWTRPQWEAAYWRWDGKSSREVAEILQIRPQNVSKRLQGANFGVVDHALTMFEKILADRALLGALEQPPLTRSRR